MKMFTKLLVAGFFAVLLAACSGGGGSGSTGQLSLAVTDAPVDSAVAVVVKFTKVELQPRNGDRITIEFDEIQEIDLLDYQGEDVHWLFENKEVPAGEYNWIRLYVERNNAADNPPASVFGTTSYVRFADGSEFNLAIPSGIQTGLKLVGGFTVAAGEETTALVIDFDLRRALVKPASDTWADYYFLRPALRLAKAAEVGHLRGEIATEIITDNTGCPENGAVYLYPGHDQEPTVVFDDQGPLASSLLTVDEGIYRYGIGHLSPGPYTVALTCEAHLDDNKTKDDIEFIDQQNVDIVAGETTVANFPSE